jgi:hypothetical protein
VTANRAVAWPVDLGEGQEGEQVLTVGALGVRAGAAADPAFQQFGDVEDKAVYLVLDAQGIASVEDGRQQVPSGVALGGRLGVNNH